jgi:hypothetical protein
MREGEQFAKYMRMAADDDLIAIPPRISDSGRAAQDSILLQPAGCPPEQPLNKKISINLQAHFPDWISCSAEHPFQPINRSVHSH